MRIRSARFFVYVTDLQVSLHFYTELLGLRVVDRVVGGTVLAAGDAELELMQERRDLEPSIDRRAGFTLFVEDADAAYAALAGEQIALISAPVSTPDGCRVFYIADPDGLPIGIMSDPPPAPRAGWLYEPQ
jgi:catechol 2,3-dioxygenase-like lactoylglutathione lyase family enzyme